MKRNFRFALIVLVATTMCVGMLQPLATAKDATPIEGVQFNTEAALADNLKIFINKDVTVHLRSGKTIQGYVKSVGNHLLHLEKLAGKDFYDALVRIEEISAFEAKFRDMK